MLIAAAYFSQLTIVTVKSFCDEIESRWELFFWAIPFLPFIVLFVKKFLSLKK